MKLIEPRTLKGFHDYLPAEQITRQAAIEKIKRVFERFGFEPLDTPALEYEDVLTGKYGDEGEALMYRFKDHGDRAVAMRYDLTVPLARVVAQYANDLPRPFKRYQVAPVWRADNTQKGRYREFVQCDVDVVGAEIGVPDAECIALVEQVMLALGLEKFEIKVNNRKILNGVVVASGVAPDKIVGAIRVIDKLEKVGAGAVAEELRTTCGLSAADAKKLIELLSSGEEKVRKVNSVEVELGFAELDAVLASLKALGVGHVEVDLTLARGLDYYTSTVIETVITETPEARKYGSVAGGGRYDGLMKMFTGKDVPAVGVAIGLDRLLPALQELGLLAAGHVTDVLVLNMGNEFEGEYLEIATELRKAGVNAEVIYEDSDMKKQFRYAEQKGVVLAVLYGEDEAAASTVTIRDLATREQQNVPRKSLAAQVLARLPRGAE